MYFSAGFLKISPCVWPNSGYWCCLFLTLRICIWVWASFKLLNYCITFLIIYLHHLSLDSFCQKNLFEWGDATIPHTADAVQLTQGISNYLIRCLAIDPPSV
jgi:hypothetical protein